MSDTLSGSKETSVTVVSYCVTSVSFSLATEYPAILSGFIVAPIRGTLSRTNSIYNYVRVITTLCVLLMSVLT